MAKALGVGRQMILETVHVNPDDLVLVGDSLHCEEAGRTVLQDGSNYTFVKQTTAGEGATRTLSTPSLQVTWSRY